MNTFLTLGTNTISKSLFLPIEDGKLGQVKPKGGLWLTTYNEEYPNFNEWIEYLTTRPSLFYLKYSITNYPATIVTLKNEAKIFILDSDSKLTELKEKYPNQDFFSYVKMSQDYDGIYVFPYKLSDPRFIHEFSCNTLTLFNLDVISYYQQAKIEFDSDVYENPEFSYTIKKKEEKRLITEENAYQEFINQYGKQIYQYINEKYPNFKQEDYLNLEKYLIAILPNYIEKPSNELVLSLVKMVISQN